MSLPTSVNLSTVRPLPPIRDRPQRLCCVEGMILIGLTITIPMVFLVQIKESGDKSQCLVINSYLKLLVTSGYFKKSWQTTTHMYTVKRFASTVKKNMLEPS